MSHLDTLAARLQFSTADDRPATYVRHNGHAAGVSSFQPTSFESNREAPTMVFSDAQIGPPPFSGQPSQNAERWLRKFQYYVHFRKLPPEEAVQFFNLLLTDVAADWIEALPDATRQNIDSLYHAFRERFDSSEICRWKDAAAVFDRKQSDGESVETFITDLLNLAKKVPIKDSHIIKLTLIKGFLPHIRQHVIQSGADSMDAVIKAARTAEAANSETSGSSSEVATLSQEVKALVTAVNELRSRSRPSSPERVDSVERGPRMLSPPRRVSFAEPPATSLYPPYDRRQPVVNVPLDWEGDDANYYDTDDSPAQYDRGPMPRQYRPPSRPPSTFPNSGACHQSDYFSMCHNCGRSHPPYNCCSRSRHVFSGRRAMRWDSASPPH